MESERCDAINIPTLIKGTKELYGGAKRLKASGILF